MFILVQLLYIFCNMIIPIIKYVEHLKKGVRQMSVNSSKNSVSSFNRSRRSKSPLRHNLNNSTSVIQSIRSGKYRDDYSTRFLSPDNNSEIYLEKEYSQTNNDKSLSRGVSVGADNYANQSCLKTVRSQLENSHLSGKSRGSKRRGSYRSSTKNYLSCNTDGKVRSRPPTRKGERDTVLPFNTEQLYSGRDTYNAERCSNNVTQLNQINKVYDKADSTKKCNESGCGCNRESNNVAPRNVKTVMVKRNEPTRVSKRDAEQMVASHKNYFIKRRNTMGRNKIMKGKNYHTTGSHLSRSRENSKRSNQFSSNTSFSREGLLHTNQPYSLK